MHIMLNTIRHFSPFRHPRSILLLFGLLGIWSAWSASQLTFRFDFEQFFPSGDPDLEFFLDFREKFEGDDNFLLIGLPTRGRFFEEQFLRDLDSLSKSCRRLPHVEALSSPTAYRYLVKSSFGLFDYPAIHLDQPERWAADSARLAGDERVAGLLFSRDFSTAVIAIKTPDQIDLPRSDELIAALNTTLEQSGFDTYHLLGRANFQSVLVAQQKREFIFSTAASGLLVFIIFIILFRKPLGVVIGLFSVLLSMLIFLGTLSAMGRPLDFMAMLYPVLMIIVGVSDVVHIFTKFHIELRFGKSPAQALRITRREIGLATLLTSATTAIGFLTLVSSKIPPVRHFGYSAAIGVLIAYLTVIFFTTALLQLAPAEKLVDLRHTDRFWKALMFRAYRFGRAKQALVAPALLAVLLLCAWGISLVSTDVRIDDGLPRGLQITEDFRFFERELAGFRPLEIAAIAAPGRRADELEVLREMDRFEEHMRTYDALGPPSSLVMVYKSLNRAAGGDRASAYRLADSERELRTQQQWLKRLPDQGSRALISEDGRYARISTSILDLGSDSIQRITSSLERFALENTDTTLLSFRQTGTGILFDKNNEYLRTSLISGLGVAFVVIGLIMAALFGNWRMVLISALPNVVPLLAGAAMMGFLGIALDASTAIIFAISFGIAVDDTIHFLSKYKLEMAKGTPVEKALYRCFTETGKAITLTSIVLFFGFCILLFSSTPGTVYVGLMIALTLFSALIADLVIIPWMIRWSISQENRKIIRASSGSAAIDSAEQPV